MSSQHYRGTNKKYLRSRYGYEESESRYKVYVFSKTGQRGFYFRSLKAVLNFVAKVSVKRNFAGFKVYDKVLKRFIAWRGQATSW